MLILTDNVKLLLAEQLNGMAVKNVQVNGKNERSSKFLNIYPSLRPSAHVSSNQVDSNMNVRFRSSFGFSSCLVCIAFLHSCWCSIFFFQLSSTVSVFGISNGSLHHINGNS